MIGLALSGGGSRAIAFHLGCLRALNELGILEKINVLSTISGGSVIGAYYAYTPSKTFDEFDKDICNILRKGFQKEIACELIKPKNIFPCFCNFLAVHAQRLSTFAQLRIPQIRRYPSRTDVFQRVLERKLFTDISLTSPRRNDLEIVIGSCELRTGTAFRFGNKKTGDWRHGEVVNGDIDVSFAVAASAAYPIFLPALDRIWSFKKKGEIAIHRVILTDGGVYDNLAIQALEPGRNSIYSLHTFPCEYLISCNAGHGQDTGEGLPIVFLPRVIKSFEVVHRRVQDSTMSRLHALKESGAIKGFAMPYLGQIDNNLPWRPGVLRPRKDVVNYPTDFSSMNDEWIKILTERGEQLTRALVTLYLRELI